MSTITYTEAAGTPVIWGESGATGGWGNVTNVLSLDALANGAARMGEVKDLGASWHMRYVVRLVVETGTAPAAGAIASAYLLCSNVSGAYEAGVTGSDAAYKAGEEAEWLKQAGIPAHVVMATADGNTVQTAEPWVWRPTGRYVVPIVFNQLGQAFRDQATAADNLSRLLLTPIPPTATVS